MESTTLTAERNNKIARLESIYFPVKKMDRGNGKYSIVNAQTNDVISDVSKRYTLVENKKVFQPFIDHFGIDNLKNLISYGNKKYYQATFETGRTFDFGTADAPDVIKERLIIANSYNKTKSFTFMLGAFRMVCSNGLYIGHADLIFKQIHVGSIPINSLIKRALEVYKSNSFKNWRALKDVALSDTEANRILDRFRCFDVKKTETSAWRDYNNNVQVNSRIRESVRRLVNAPESIDNQRNAWGLYNQINRAIGSVVYGKSKVDKRILGNKNAEAFLLSEFNLN